ncbi:MAG: hypothetical protein ACTSVG_06450 [Alphaproteobacteria bacterium]
MATYQSYSTVFSEQRGGSDEQFLVTIEYGADFTGDGFDDVRVTLTLTDGSNSGIEDVIGVAFDIQDNAVAGLEITDIQTATDNGTLSSYSASYVIGADMVAGNGALDPGFNTSGSGSDAPYDVGLMVSLPGSGEGIVQSFSFVLTDPGGDLDAEALLENTDWWVRVQSTDGGEDSAKTGGFIEDLPSPGDGGGAGLGGGTANTPGFWKNHAAIFGLETGQGHSDSFETLFGVDVVGSRKLNGDPSLAEALGARVGGEAALLRAATAAWANAVSDDVNYVLDPGALEQGAVDSFGLNPDNFDFAADLAAAMATLTDTLGLVDNNADGILQGGEIIGAVRDVYDTTGAAGDDFDWADVKDLARALDAMNNMPSVETADFLA